jgi:hypothetical protein
MSSEYKYRFKTEKEFEKEFGLNWREINHYMIDWVLEMDYLFGQVYPYLVFSPLEKGYYFQSHNGFNITHYMLTLIELPKPNYNPKKFSREI